MYKKLAVIFVFLFLVIIFTWPLAAKLGSSIPGFSSTDEPFGTLWNYWRIKFSWENKLSLRYCQLIGFPFGQDLFRSGYIPYLYTAYYYILSILLTATVAYNLQLILNLFLGGLCAYLLALRLIKNRAAALFSGIAFGFCPYQFARMWQHPGLTFNQLFPFALLSIFVLREKATLKNILLFFISLILLYSFDLHIAFFGSIILGLFLFYCTVIAVIKGTWKFDSLFLKKALIIWVLALAVMSFQYFSFFKNRLALSETTQASAHNPYRRAFEDLFEQSARPLSYVLPATVHPVFGSFTEHFLGTKIYGMSLTEHTLYLGWLPMILAFIAVRALRKRKDLFSNEDSFNIRFLFVLAFTAWLCSQPPWWQIGPIKILMPSFFIYKLLPMFRAYCRFGIVLSLAISLLSGFGFYLAVRQKSSFAKRLVWGVLFFVILLFEFWNWPPQKIIEVSKVPSAYSWLRDQPGNIVIAEYPFDEDSPDEMYKFFQSAHGKRIVNGTIPGSAANQFVRNLVKLSDPKASELLSVMNVKYILVHKDRYLDTDFVEDREELAAISSNPGLKLVKRFPAQDCPEQGIMCVQKTGNIDVYEVLRVNK